jgi:hypothetical protein
MSAPPVQYADSSGVEIAYQVLGDGPLDLIWVARAFTHLGVLWEDPGYRRLCEQLEPPSISSRRASSRSYEAPPALAGGASLNGAWT